VGGGILPSGGVGGVGDFPESERAAEVFLRSTWNYLLILSCTGGFAMLDLKEIRSVTDFQRNAKTHVARIKRSKTPLVLTVNGRAEVVVQDATAYQELLDRVETLEAELAVVAAIRVGLEDKAEGRVRPARAALKALGKKLAV
jgi:PHD/YefM family antitoxin component YafN of YafNO toxin-antitoxin module